MRLALPSSSLADAVFRSADQACLGARSADTSSTAFWSTCCDWLLSGAGQATTDKIAPGSRKRVTRFFIVKSILKVLLLRCDDWNLGGSSEDG